MSEVALNFQATFCVSGLLTTENDDFIYSGKASSETS